MKSKRRLALPFGDSWWLVAFLSLSIISAAAAIVTLPQTQTLFALYFATQLCGQEHAAGAVAFGHCAACWAALASFVMAATSIVAVLTHENGAAAATIEAERRR